MTKKGNRKQTNDDLVRRRALRASRLAPRAPASPPLSDAHLQ
jgi:hypothetical protein